MKLEFGRSTKDYVWAYFRKGTTSIVEVRNASTKQRLGVILKNKYGSRWYTYGILGVCGDLDLDSNLKESKRRLCYWALRMGKSGVKKR